MSHGVNVPRTVRLKAQALGQAGTDWLEALPRTVHTLERLWGIRVGQSMPGSSEAYVAAATEVRTGEGCVVKIFMPGYTSYSIERMTLADAAGDGYARLPAASDPGQALLLERLGPPVSDLVGDFMEQARWVIGALSRVWRDGQLPGTWTTCAKARWYAKYLQDGADILIPLLPSGAMEHIRDLAQRLAGQERDGTWVRLHGDAHPGNLLSVPRTGDRPDGFRLIDPESIFGPREYDLAVLGREYLCRYGAAEDTMRAWRRLLKGAVGPIDVATSCAWTVLEALATGVMNVRIGDTTAGMELLNRAAALLPRTRGITEL